MTSREILQSDFLDILFENRNKHYGAYSLRRNYNTHMAAALGISLGSVFLLLLLINTPATTENFVPHPPIVTVRTSVIPVASPENKKPQPVTPSTKPVRKVAREQLTNISIVNKDVVDIMPSLPDLQGADIGTGHSDGLATNNPIQSSLQGVGNRTEGTVEKTVEKSFVPVERTAQFPGGTQAWMRFLYQHLHVPDELEAGEKKTVLIRFEVAADGAVTKFEVMQSAGILYDNEVIRVLKKMPRWMPAVQNGNVIATTFTQPVTFVGLE